MLLIGAVTFALGVLSFAIGIASLRILSPGLTGLVVVALVVFAASRFVPLFAVQAYVQAAAALVSLWPLAGLMWSLSPAPIGGTARASTTPVWGAWRLVASAAHPRAPNTRWCLYVAHAPVNGCLQPLHVVIENGASRPPRRPSR